MRDGVLDLLSDLERPPGAGPAALVERLEGLREDPPGGRPAGQERTEGGELHQSLHPLGPPEVVVLELALERAHQLQRTSGIPARLGVVRRRHQGQCRHDGGELLGGSRLGSGPAGRLAVLRALALTASS